MNSFEVITKYLPQAVDKYFYEDAKSAVLEKGSKFIDVKFDETGYVKILDILMDGLSDYYQTQQDTADRLAPGFPRPGGVGNDANPADYAAYAGNLASGSRDGFAIGGVSNQWEILRLQYVRGRQFRIDYIADEETAGAIIGNIAEEFVRTKVIPEVDATRFSFIVGKTSASLGNRHAETLTSGATGGGSVNILDALNRDAEWMSEHEVDKEDMVVFHNPAVTTLLMQTKENGIVKPLYQEDFKGENGITFKVKKYNEMNMIEVPSNRFFNEILLTQNGYRPSANSKTINYIMCSMKAIVPVRKLEYQKIYGPEQSGLAGFHGYLMNFLIYHGCFVPKNKLPAVVASLSATAASAKSFTLAVQTVAGDAQYGWKLANYFTNPAGLRGTIVFIEEDSTASTGTYKKDGFTLGAALTGTAGTDYKVLNVGENVTEAAGSVKAFFALVDARGTIIATSGATAVALEQHA